MAKRMLSLPLGDVFDHPAYWRLSASGRGMLLSILERFWRGGAHPIDLSKNTLVAMANTQPAHFSRQAADLTELLRDTLPKLSAEYQRRSTAARQLRIAASHGGQAAAARNRQRAAESRLAALPSAVNGPAYVSAGAPVREKPTPRPSPAERREGVRVFSEKPNR